ncbi:GNAT family N-acetyltransferase [Psychroserpens sp.]|uniref:GNAT family N-acetyltransferase n=1 Tax=Psychroserpens sp. TaxID=2020870 RepID=UPI002B270240|nr:GNAT family N-acetyltransferase [Psychroserpens sp.]
MKQNPFTSTSFISIWSKHFNGSKTPFTFEFISGVKFLKHSFLPLYENIGENLTKGIFYTIDYSKSDYKGKTLLIYDVPHYFNVEDLNPPSNSSLKLKKIFQYQGFLMDISSYESQDDYINAQFSSKNRREFRANMRKLETCFNIRYSFIHGEISQSEFDVVFNQFYDLLNKRFDGKQTNYHHLRADKWTYYQELVFTMLQEKKASLLIIYRDDTPIGVTLNFHSEDVLFETITVFDPDYYKFSVGKTSIIKLIEWCFENNYRISDFSKGDFDYKHKWGNVVYDFDYHVLYDSKSLVSILTATYIETYFKFKLFLRRKKVNELYRKYKYLLTGGKDDDKSSAKQVIKFEKIDEFDATSSNYIDVDYTDKSNDFLLQYVYTFGFANPEPIDQIKVFKDSRNTKEFVISGSKKAQRITFK